MISELKVGPIVAADSAQTIQRADKQGATVTTDAHGRYAEATVRGVTFQLSYPATAIPTAYVGAAAGTPLLAVYNPTGSGKNILILSVGISNRVVASAIGPVSFSIWAVGVSVQPTGTQTVPKNMLTQQQAGSIGLGFVNTATTASTALNLAQPLLTHFWGTSVGQTTAAGYFDLGGSIVAAPGVLIGFGAATALTGATYDVSMTWEEVPI